MPDETDDPTAPRRRGDQLPDLGDLPGSDPVPADDLVDLGGLGDMGGLLQAALQMQQRLADAQEQVAATVIEGDAGGGAVRIEVTGGLEFRAVHIEPSAVDPGDVEMLEDLVLAALRDAMAKLSELQRRSMPGLGLPGMGAAGMPSGLDLGGLDLGDLLGGGAPVDDDPADGELDPDDSGDGGSGLGGAARGGPPGSGS